MSDIDVVVAGAGAAGLAAALASAQQGVSVLLIDGSETFREGSNTAMSTSMIPAGGSRFQVEAGVDDGPDRFLDDIRRKTGGTVDEAVATALTRAAPDLVHWLHDDCAVPLSLVTDFNYPGHSALRCHAVEDRSGRTLHRHLLEAADGLTNLDLVVPLSLTGLTEGAQDLAIELCRPDGTMESLRSRNVVLATNGFGAAPELVRRHVPEIADALYHGGDGARGDALRLGASLGADTDFLDAYQGHGSVATPHGILLTWATVMHGGILVDADGHRFGDETVGYSEFGSRVVARRGGTAWMIYDERTHRACLPFRDYQDVVEAGAVTWSQDDRALAERIGCRTEELAQTIQRAHRAAVAADDDEFGRRHWEAPLAAPYAAVKVTGALFHTQGGLRVDGQARVQRGGNPITGLYAAGGAAIGISGRGADGYLAGNGLLGALGLGYLAGQHAAATTLHVDQRER